MAKLPIDNPIVDEPNGSDVTSKFYKIRSAKLYNVATGNDKINWSEPSTIATSDPLYNHITKTASGHTIEYDDTPGAERVMIAHCDGTFFELTNDYRTFKVFGKDYELIMDDKNLFVGGGLNITVVGDVNLLTKGNVNQKVEGNYSLVVNGNYSQRVKGATIVYSVGALDIQSKAKLSLLTPVQLSIKSGSTLSLEGANTASLKGATAIVDGSSSASINGTATYAIHSQIFGVGGQILSATAVKLKDLDPKSGLTIPDSLCTPSVYDQFANRTLSNATLSIRDSSLTYPEDRTKAT